MPKTLWKDLGASIVVFLVAMPLCMGIAIASGVPPALGLITGIVGGVIVGLLAGSPLQVSGPAAGLAVLVFEIVRDLGLPMLGTILLAAGIIQIAAGFLRIGFWFRAISPAVVYGMLAGIGVLIFAGQFHVMLDDKPRASGIANLLSIPAAIYSGIFPIDGSPHELAAVIGLLTIATMVLWAKFRPAALSLVPGPLIAILLSSGLALLLKLPIQYVNIPDHLLDSVRLPTVETISRLTEPSILGIVAALAFIASAETMLSAVAVDRLQSAIRANYDKELIAQGIGNTLCGALGALPMTGVIVRSSANVQAGARSRLSAILHGVWLLIAVLSLPNVLRLIPTCALAAILVYTGYKLVNPDNVRTLMRYGKIPVAIYFATVAGIVVFDLLTGVIVGIALSLAKLLYKASFLQVRLERVDERRMDLHLEGSATFLRLPRLASVLESVPPNTDLHIHVERLHYIDHVCMDLIAQWDLQNRERGSRLVVQWEGLAARYWQTTVERENVAVG
ncbi:MAG: SulP family inorganic anion transporter [Bryobacteraceae bacterium]|nr:SulP family inorganic anion transporter [Bryobacteraceae bacterium]